MTITREHLGQNATQADLDQFRAWVNELATRDGITPDDAEAILWGDGDIYGTAASLDLTCARR